MSTTKTSKWDALASAGNDENKDWLQASGAQQIKWSETSEVVIRPIGPILFMARHWPKSLISGKNTPPIWCPKYNPLTNKFEDDRECQLHDDFKDVWKAQKTILFAAIVRDWQEDGATPRKNPIAIMSFSWQVKDLLNKVVSINKFDISDPVKGCDISISYNATAKGNTPRFVMMRTDRTPLTEAELAMVEGTGKIKMPDLDKISPDFGDPEFRADYNKQMKQKLASFAYYVSRKEDADGEGWENFKKDVEGKPYTKFSELVALVDDGSKKNTDKPKRRRDDDDDEDEPKKPAGKKRNSDDDDDDPQLKRRSVVDDGDDDAPPPKMSKKAPPPDDDDDGDDDVKPAKKNSKTPPPEDDDGGDDGGDDGEASEDEDKPTPSTKKAPPPDDDDDDDDDEVKPAPKKASKAPPPDEDEDGDDEAAKAKARAKVKDEDAEPPFEPDEKPKKAAVRSGFEDWSEEHTIKWKIGEAGKSFPKCFPVYENAEKCKGCPVRKSCKAQQI